MTKHQVSVFMEERKWDYRCKPVLCSLLYYLSLTHSDIAFGFVASLLEGLPIIGLVFTISNRIGAAMWAHGQFFLCYSRYSLLKSIVLDYAQIWRSSSILSLTRSSRATSTQR